MTECRRYTPDDSEKYTPDDLIETEGIDMGRVKDQELARIGANAEKRARRSPGRIIERIDDKLGLVVGQEGTWEKESIKFAGEEAMSKEISRRAATSKETEGLSPEGKKRFADSSGWEFRNEQERMTKERIAKEVEKASEK